MGKTLAPLGRGTPTQPWSGPVFVLSLARSGSTLTRFILDTHPEIYSPAELHLGELAVALYRTIAGLEEQGTYTVSIAHMRENPRVVMRVREVIHGLVTPYARSRGKRIWCEKTPDNLENSELLAGLFPEARFICLYRHAMDLTQSCLNACREGFIPVLREYIRRSPDNSVGAVVSYWVEGVSALLDFERARSGQAFRLRYEDLVAAPEVAIGAMFAFLGLEWDRRLIDEIFATEHADGLGDSLIRFTREIRQDSVGAGRGIPITSVPISLRKSLDLLLEQLSYDLFQEGPKRAVRQAPVRARHGRPEAAGEGPKWVFETMLTERLREQTRSLLMDGESYLFVVRGDGGGSWALRGSGEGAQVIPGEETGNCRVELDATDFLRIVRREVDVLRIVGEGRIQISGQFDQAALRKLLALLQI